MERLEKLNATLVGGDLVDIAIAPAAEGLLLAIKARVRDRGEGTDGNQLRRYSTKPMYASPSQFVGSGFKAEGKSKGIGDRLVPTIRLKQNGVKKNPTKYSRYSLVKPNYQVRKTMYLEDGYKELRDVQGLVTNITNMSYSGKMLADYQSGREGDAIVLGITTQRSAQIYEGQTYGTSKMRGMGQFLQASAIEIQEYGERATFALKRLTVGILQTGEVIQTPVTQ